MPIFISLKFILSDAEIIYNDDQKINESSNDDF